MDVTLGDVTGTAKIQVDDASFAAKSKLLSLTSGTAKFIDQLPQRIDSVNFQCATLGCVFQSPKIAIDKTRSLTVKGGANSILTRYTSHDTPLLGKDPTVPAVAIGSGDYWLSFELDATLEVSGAAQVPSGFGVAVDVASTVKLSQYTLFTGQPALLPTLGNAIGAALNDFGAPLGAAAVRNQKAGTVRATDICGTVTVSGSYSLPIAVNQLALAQAVVPFKIQINPQLGVKLTGSLALTGDYAVRCWRASDSELVLGLFKKRGTTLGVAFAAGAGLVADAGSADLIKMFFDAIAPGVDLATSGLPSTDPRYAAITKVLNDCVNRSLQLAMNASCAATYGDESAMVYSIDLTSNRDDTDRAIDQALGGDWSLLATLPNIKELKNVVGGSRETKSTLAINLLGVFSYESVGDFVQSFTVLHNEEDGSVTITDQATASRIAVASSPYLANPDKLRLALYEGMIATTTYTAAGGQKTAALTTNQSLLIYHANTNRAALRKELRLAVAIGELNSAQLESLPITNPRPAHVLIDASQKITGTQATNMYFADPARGTPHNLDALKQLGRQILASLLDPSDSVDQRRIEVLNSDSIWAQMDHQQFPQDSPASYTDWYDVTFWANAIHDVAAPLWEVIQAWNQIPAGTDPATVAAFTKKRDALRKALGEVTRDTHAAFEKGWPIAVSCALAGKGTGAALTARWDGAQHIPMDEPTPMQPNALAKRLAARQPQAAAPSEG